MKRDSRERWGGIVGKARKGVKKTKDRIKWTGSKQLVVNKILEELGK